MDIHFKTSKLQKRCEREREATKAWGKKDSQKLLRRLAQIEAVDTLADLSRVHGVRWHHLKTGRKGQLAIELRRSSGRRIVFKPYGSDEEYIQGSEIDPSRVTAIIILEVRDYHHG